MKTFPVACLTLLFCIFSLSANAQSTNVDIFGYYYIEKSPKAFADISEIHLAGEYGAGQKPPFYGLIRMKAKKAKDFHLLKPTLSGKNLTFSTKSVGGINYTFSGAFTKLGNFPSERPDGEVLLKGTLIKFKGKIKIAEMKVSFSYFAGD
jgi:hypothetical protein